MYCNQTVPRLFVLFRKSFNIEHIVLFYKQTCNESYFLCYIFLLSYFIGIHRFSSCMLFGFSYRINISFLLTLESNAILIKMLCKFVAEMLQIDPFDIYINYIYLYNVFGLLCFAYFLKIPVMWVECSRIQIWYR